MEQIDDCCHQFEWLHQQQHQHMSAINPADPHIPTAVYQSLDTVRALHQTVVYLRKALEKAHREIDTLKKQITVKDDIEEGKKYREQEFVAKNSHPDSLLLDIDDIEDSDAQNNSNDIKLQARSVRDNKTNLKNNESKTFENHSAQRESTESLNSNSSPVQSAKSSHKTTTTKHTQSTEHHFQHSLKAREVQSTGHPTQTHLEEKEAKNHTVDKSTILSDRKLPQMASKIDVKIKLTSHFQIDGNDTSSETTGDNVSGILFICSSRLR